MSNCIICCGAGLQMSRHVTKDCASVHFIMLVDMQQHHSMSDTCLTVCGVAAGHLVSGYVKQHLPIMLVNHLSMENDASKALTKGQSCFLLGGVHVTDLLRQDSDEWYTE